MLLVISTGIPMSSVSRRPSSAALASRRSAILSRSLARSPGRASAPRPPALAPAAVALELLLERVHDEVHDGDIRLDAVELQLSMQVLRDTRGELNPDFPFTCCHDPSFSPRSG